MAEPIFLRVRRVLSASAESTVDAIEQVSASSILRETIRQVDRAIDDVRAEHRSASQRGIQAQKLQQAIKERIDDLEVKARFALGKGRADLAEAAISSQVDLEARIVQLESARREASEQVSRLDSCLGDLQARKTKMEMELRDFQKNRDSARNRECSEAIERRVERAQATFERVKSGSVSDADLGGIEPDDNAELAEIEALRRSAVVAERLASLRAGASPASNRRRSRSQA